MKRKVLIILSFVFCALSVFAESEIESEWEVYNEVGGEARVIFYKNKTFSMTGDVDSMEVGFIGEGTFEGDTTKDGEILILMTDGTVKADVMKFDIHITEDSFLINADMMGDHLEGSLKKGEDGLFHGAFVVNGVKQYMNMNQDEILESFGMRVRVQGDSLFIDDDDPMHRVK